MYTTPNFAFLTVQVSPAVRSLLSSTPLSDDSFGILQCRLNLRSWLLALDVWQTSERMLALPTITIHYFHVQYTQECPLILRNNLVTVIVIHRSAQPSSIQLQHVNGVEQSRLLKFEFGKGMGGRKAADQPLV
jgi:hypothetical protein